MKKETKSDRIRSTVYLDPAKQKILKRYALETGKSASDVLNDALEEYIEDIADYLIVKEREKDAEYLPWEQLEEELKADGII